MIKIRNNKYYKNNCKENEQSNLLIIYIKLEKIKKFNQIKKKNLIKKGNNKKYFNLNLILRRYIQRFEI